MEENRKLEEILSRIEESERKQETYMKRQFLMTMIMAACCVGVLLAVILAYQNIVPTAQDALLAIGNVTKDLGEISAQLTEADLGSLVEHVDQMAVTSEEGIKLRVNRSIQAEGAFGAMKEDMDFRRFLTRGKENITVEYQLLCLGFNINKLHNKILSNKCGQLLYKVPKAA